MDRIAFTHSASILGGSERAFLDLIQNLNESQRKAAIFILPQKGALSEELAKKNLGHATYIVSWPFLFNLSSRKTPLFSYLGVVLAVPWIFISALRTIHILRKNSINTIYSNGIKSHILSLLYKKILGTNVIWHMQDYFPGFRFVKFFCKTMGVAPDILIANSKSVLEEFKKLDYGWDEIKYEVVHNAVNTSDYSIQARGYKEDVVISMVGMLTPWKGQEVFIEAIYRLINENPELKIKCNIVGGEVYQTLGESGYRKKLEDLVERLKLNHVIRFLGLVEDVSEIYSQSDIVAHCSTLPEPFGRVIIEAMSCQCAVVATDAGGVKEIIENRKNGLLVAPGNVAALKDALMELISNDDLRLTIARNGRQTVENKFSAKTYAESIIRLIEKAA